jgi:hypothetical protein
VRGEENSRDRRRYSDATVMRLGSGWLAAAQSHMESDSGSSELC